MSYNLRLLTTESRDLVVDAMRAEAAKRTRVAQGAALAVAEDRAAKRDVRSASVRVTALLAEAGRLDQLATELAHAEDVPVVTGPVPPLAVPQPAGAVILTALDEHALDVTLDQHAEDAELAAIDDGLSEAAHQAAELAGLEDALLDPDGEDVETGALAEDEPTPDDVAEVLK